MQNGQEHKHHDYRRNGNFFMIIKTMSWKLNGTHKVVDTSTKKCIT